MAGIAAIHGHDWRLQRRRVLAAEFRAKGLVRLPRRYPWSH